MDLKTKLKKKRKNSDFLKSEVKFKISKSEISDLFTEYEKRNFGEDILLLKSIGGTQGLFEKVKSSPEGLSNDKNEHFRRIQEYDSNLKIKKELPHLCWFVWESLKDCFIRILILCSIIQIIVGLIPAITNDPKHDWIDGLSIMFAVILVVFVTSLTNYLKEKKFRELNTQSDEMSKVTILRNNEIEMRSEEDLLVGDIVKFGYGNIVPADGYLIEGNDIKVDESPLTGESELISKDLIEECEKKLEKKKDDKNKNKNMIPSPLIFSGTSIKTGQGSFLVLRVGVNSAKGKIQQKVIANQEENAKTPLEEKLEEIAEDIGKFGFLASFLTMTALLIRFGITYNSLVGSKSPDDNLTKVVTIKIIKIIILCVTIIVVAIPEGLPLAVTLNLAFSVQHMMVDNNLVRKIQACETMGGANYICTDKTGTLTKNIMTVNCFYDGKKIIDFSKNQNGKLNSIEFFNDIYYEFLKNSICNNLQSELDKNDEPKNASKTDLAFIKFFHNFGVNITQIKKKFNKIEKVFPFNSDRKKMSTIIKTDVFPSGNVIFLKGASEIVLDSCKYSLNKSNDKVEISEIERKHILKIIKSLADKALRTIGVAFKELSNEEVIKVKIQDDPSNIDIENNDFTLIGIFGIRDTLRDNVDEAIEMCHNAGINVIMVTGDNLDTAIAIAKDCKILNVDSDNSEVLTSMIGTDFYKEIEGLECMTCQKDIKLCKCSKTATEAELNGNVVRKDGIKNMVRFKEIAKNLKVLARSRPEDKYTLVTGLKQLGYVVAVTGDGTNDAEALSKSDVGFAMGIQGTDIAKEASDIILLDDNFSNIVKAVLWGRNIFDNIRKFIQFQLTVNICGVGIVFVCCCIGNETPISSIQMLWINLIMDSLGSIALSTESPDNNLLKRKPYSRSEYIINNLMWKHLIFQSLFQFIILIILYTSGQNFIYEDNVDRLNITQTIMSCYGIIPGTNISTVQNRYKILSGKSIDWSISQKIVNMSACIDYSNFSNLNLAFGHYISTNGATCHMTIIFNTFVFYTIFNQINSRILNDDFNIFKNLHHNIYFIVIIFTECVLQVIIITFGSTSFNVCNNGLTASQWGICIGFSLVTFLVSIIAKLLPLERCFENIKFFIKRICCCRKTNKVEIEDIIVNDLDEINLITKRKLGKKVSKKSIGKSSKKILKEKTNVGNI